MKKALVTGSCGLIGSEVSIFLDRSGFQVYGVDNNERAVFFGPEGDTSWSLRRLRSEIKSYDHSSVDIRDRQTVLDLVRRVKPDIIVHTAAQPSRSCGRYSLR